MIDTHIQRDRESQLKVKLAVRKRECSERVRFFILDDLSRKKEEKSQDKLLSHFLPWQ